MSFLALLIAVTVPLAPTPAPDPSPSGPGINLIPNYITNGDGTRMQCTPSLNQCWRDTSGLPNYLS